MKTFAYRPQSSAIGYGAVSTMSTYQLAGGNRIAGSLVARNPVPDVCPISSMIDLHRALSGHCATGRTAPLIDSVVAGRVRRYECGVEILAAIAVGASIPFRTICFDVAAVIGADRANIDCSVHTAPKVVLRRQWGLRRQSQRYAQKGRESRWDGGGATLRCIDSANAGAISEWISNCRGSWLADRSSGVANRENTKGGQQADRCRRIIAES